MSDSMKKNIYSILLGIGTGLFMSILVLYMLIASFFDISSFAFVLTVIAGCAIPFCLSFLRKKNWNVFLSQAVMIATSYLITILYGGCVNYAGEISSYSSIFVQVLAASSLVHGLSFVTAVIGEMVYRNHPVQK
jgi:uncharacterized membrane protein